MKIAAIGFTEQGCTLACTLRDALAYHGHDVDVCGPQRFADKLGIAAYDNLDAWTRSAFKTCPALLFVSATGIAVRAIAPYVQDKFCDPAVVSIDEAGSFAIPLLSGHVGGANDLAREVAQACGAQPVISTATDVNNLFAIDEWARKQNLAILDRSAAKEISSALLAGTPVGFASDFKILDKLPAGFINIEDGSLPAIGASVSLDTNKQPFKRTLRLVPRVATIGIGCRRNTSVDQIAVFVDACLDEAHICPKAVSALASIDVKANEEGILTLARNRGWETHFYTAEQLAAVPGEFTHSDFVEQTVGVDNVCERAACAEGATLALPRRSHEGITVAIALHTPALSFGSINQCPQGECA